MHHCSALNLRGSGALIPRMRSCDGLRYATAVNGPFAHPARKAWNRAISVHDHSMSEQAGGGFEVQVSLFEVR